MTNNFFYKVTAQANVSQPARLDLFGVIGGGFWEEGFDEKSFKDAMSVVKETQPLDIFLNSPGGSVFAGIAILNLLKQHKGAIRIFVMGIAASAATLITSAPNARVIMPTGSMLMVHAPRLSASSMTAKQLKEAGIALEKIEESVKQIYVEKTGMKEADLAEMISHETYMTAAEAVAKGFADEVDTTQKVTNSFEDNVVMLGGMPVQKTFFDNAPKDFLNKLHEDVAQTEKKSILNQNEEVAMTLEEIKAQHPELYKQIRDEGREEGLQAGMTQERNRIKAIEEMALAGHEAIVAKAKFETGMTAEQLAVEMIKAEKAKTATMAQNRENDAAELKDVGSATASVDATPSMTDEEKERAELLKGANDRLAKMHKTMEG